MINAVASAPQTIIGLRQPVVHSRSKAVNDYLRVETVMPSPKTRSLSL